jgi:hypothetical protein
MKLLIAVILIRQLGGGRSTVNGRPPNRARKLMFDIRHSMSDVRFMNLSRQILGVRFSTAE